MLYRDKKPEHMKKKIELNAYLRRKINAA